MGDIPEDEAQQKLNKELEEYKNRLKDQYPDTFKKLEGLVDDIYLTSRSLNEINRILTILIKYENFVQHYNYDLKSDIYNFDKFYLDYYTEISENKDVLLEDLLFIFKLGYIDLFMPNKGEKTFRKSNESFGQFKDPYPFIEILCKLSTHMHKGKSNLNVIIHFTPEGDRYRKEQLIEYSIHKAAESQKELQELQKELKKKIDNHTKEIISIIAIVLAFAPVIAINITAVQKFTLTEMLIVNGCLILGITTIFSVVNVAFFKLKPRHGLLIIPLLLGIALIYFGLQSPKQVSTTPAAAPVANKVPAPAPAKP